MSKITSSHLKAGIIFGDHTVGEYVYMPAGEVGMSEPLCIFETSKGQTDLPLDAATALIYKLSLRPVKHPRLGSRSY